MQRFSGPKANIGAVCHWAISGIAVALVTSGVARADFAPAPPVLAPDDVNVLHPYVADQETYDSNLFRVPTNIGASPLSTILPNATRSDWINTGTLGAVAQWELGRQAVNLDARVDENRFAHNDALNFVSADASVIWDWRLGAYFSGTAQVIYDRSLASFGETRFLGKDLVSSTEGLISGRYQIGPRWAIYGDVRGSTTQHSAEAAEFNNFHNASGDASVEYATDVDDTFTLRYSYVRLTFPQDAIVTSTPLDYNEDAERFLVKYALTDKTSIDGYAGYLQRTYPGSSIGAYGGDIWRANVRWQATDKTQFVVSAWHELHAYIDAESDYFVAKGYSFAPLWAATEKVTISLLAQLENQDYIGSSTSVLTLGERHDKVDSEQLTVKYTPRSPLTILVNFRHEKRESNQYEFTYTDNLASVSASYKFR